MAKPLDLTGQRFGKLTAIKWTGVSSPEYGRVWLCQCDCGKYREVSVSHLKTYNVRSCKECARINKENNWKEICKTSKARRRERLYAVWQSMKQRCHNPTNKDYKFYGKRGIKVCSEWYANYDCFKKWAVENGYKENLSIDRINNEGDYCPDNCRFIPLRYQAFNRRKTYVIIYNGKSIPISELAYEIGVDRGRLQRILDYYK